MEPYLKNWRRTFLQISIFQEKDASSKEFQASVNVTVSMSELCQFSILKIASK